MRKRVSFALYYAGRSRYDHLGDAAKSFFKAARTWGAPDTILLPFEHVVDIHRAFKLLENRANERRLRYISGALFMHSIDAHEGGGLGQISVPRLPVTLAELHRLEEIRNLGLDSNLLGGTKLAKLPQLQWSHDAKLWLFGCNSGIGPNSLAEQFAKNQRVVTFGEMGFCAFSKSANKFEKIDYLSQTVYLRAFFRTRNLILAMFPDEPQRRFAWYNHALPESRFDPPNK